MGRIHGVEDILLGFEPKDAGSIPAGSVDFFFKKKIYSSLINVFPFPPTSFTSVMAEASGASGAEAYTFIL